MEGKGKWGLFVLGVRCFDGVESPVWMKGITGPSLIGEGLNWFKQKYSDKFDPLSKV